MGPTLVDSCPAGAPGLARQRRAWPGAPAGHGSTSVGLTVDPYGTLPLHLQQGYSFRPTSLAHLSLRYRCHILQMFMSLKMNEVFHYVLYNFNFEILLLNNFLVCRSPLVY